MATPTILSVDGAPTAPVAPGTTVDLTVNASDTDTRQVTVTFTVTDQSGAVSSPTSVNIDVVDTLTFSGSTGDPSATVVQDGSDPSLFHVTV